MKRRYMLATVGILVAFAIGLVGYLAVGTGGDGLEKTMENGGVHESEPAYKAPLSYGSGFFGLLIAGIVGFGATLGIVYGYLKVSKKTKPGK